MIITRTPFRVSFFGGGSDLSEFYAESPAAVLSTTIDKYMYMSSHRFFHEDRIQAKYSSTELVSGAENLKHPILREVLRKFGIDGAIEISSTADIPSGTGLGSSSSFTVGLLHNLYARSGRYPTKEMLASDACEIEIGKLKEPIGKQDQYAAAFGGLNVFTFLPSGQVNVEPILLTNALHWEFRQNLLLYYTGKTRSASLILSEQRANMKQSDKRLILSKMVELVWKGRETLYSGDFDQFGKLLHQSWLWKKQLAPGISDEEIDRIYLHAMNNGASGGKLLGAGGGGFLLLVCGKDRQAGLRKAMAPFREIGFELENQGSQVIYFTDENTVVTRDE